MLLQTGAIPSDCRQCLKNILEIYIDKSNKEYDYAQISKLNAHVSFKVGKYVRHSR